MAGLTYFCMSATPFAADGSVDEAALRAHLGRMVEAGLGVYLGSGGAGEGHALADAELERVYAVGVAACQGRVPVFANPPEQRTAAGMKRLCALAAGTGVDVVQVYAPDPGHGMRPTERELAAYYDAVLSALDSPAALSVHTVVGYLVPLRLVIDLTRRFPQIRAVNLIGVSLNYLADLRAAIDPAIRLYVPLPGCLDALALGADGVLGAEPNLVPRTCRAFADAWAAGDRDELRGRYGQLLALSQAVAPWTPSTARWVKMAFRLFGLPGGDGGVRPPYLLPPDEEIAALGRALRALGLPEIDALSAERDAPAG